MPSDPWPNDADGDVLRRMQSRGFDFSKTYVIDFNVDFGTWPPSEEVFQILQRAFPTADIYDYSDSEDPHLLLKIEEKLTYDFVIGTQARVTVLVKDYGGRCDSWGILHD